MLKQYTATAVLVSNGTPRKILLGLHRKLGVWLPPGGHQEENENPIETIIREAREETGFDITPFVKNGEKLEDNVTKVPLPDFFLEEGIPPYGDQPFHIHMDWNYVVFVPEFVPDFPKREYDDMQWFGEDVANQLPTFTNIKEYIIPKVFGA